MTIIIHLQAHPPTTVPYITQTKKRNIQSTNVITNDVVLFYCCIDVSIIISIAWKSSGNMDISLYYGGIKYVFRFRFV